MSSNPNRAWRRSKRVRDFAGRLLCVETEKQDRSLAFANGGKTGSNAIAIERDAIGRVDRRVLRIEARVQSGTPALAASLAGRHHPAGAEDERPDLIGVVHLSGPKTSDDDEH